MTAAPQLSVRHVAAAVSGNALEFYDFITYAFFAVQIGRVFFPAHSGYVSLMLSLGTFAAGFVMRPIGGIVIGRYADRVGRRPAMQFSLMLMGAAILAVAIMPSYAAIGAAAPVLVVAARMAQGFALGGQVGPATAYLMEAAPPGERGFYAALQGGSQYLAVLAGGLVGVLLSALMNGAELQAYGWRVAFVLGALALPIGLYLLRDLPETLHLPDAATPSARPGSSWELWRAHGRVIVLGLVTLASATIFTYVTNYMTTFAETVLHLGNGISFAATLVTGVCGIAGALYGAWLSDRIGRLPAMIWPRVAYLLLVWPLYLWMVSERSAAAVLCTSAMLVFLGAMSFGPYYAALTESLPRNIRGSTFGTIYAVSIAIFGGSAQLIVTWLIHITDNPIAPAWYLLASGLCGLVAVALMPETAPVRLGLATAPVE
ncbi:MAG TPA: MFS transporter [Rhizomicrobium sp.]